MAPVSRKYLHLRPISAGLCLGTAVDDNTPVQPGVTVGRFRIDALLGTGGMGEVYRAHDLSLHRDVAIKVLPSVFSADPERLARFRREAQLLASLNHPNIGSIHGIEHEDGVPVLVLELVEGPTLADRIAQGSLPLDEALAVARQIAGALEAAHERGIVHRDLKPANIKVRDDGTVKVLDFGLAKIADAGGPGGDNVTESPTITSPAMTAAGIILGTAAYMSPEQAKGKPADKRSDIWAFGCVLFEMLTGKRAFEGEDVGDTLASILRSEPDWRLLPDPLPSPVENVLRRSLVKDRRARLPEIAVVRFLLDEPSAFEAAPSNPRGRRQLAAAAGAVLAASVITGAIVWQLRPPATAPARLPVRFSLTPSNLALNPGYRALAISQDGKTIAFHTGGSQLDARVFVRDVDQLDERLLAGPPAAAPFFSPDGRWVGFVAGRELRKAPVEGGPTTLLCTFEGTFFGATWTSLGQIVFASGVVGSRLYMVPASGGTPELIPAAERNLDSRRIQYAFPSALPNGKQILVTIAPGATQFAQGDATRQIVTLDLETGAEIILVNGGTQAEYLDAGFIIYAVEGTLRAMRFDADALRIDGDTVVVLPDQVLTKATTGAVDFGISRNGNLVYVPSRAGVPGTLRTLVWVDRSGQEAPLPAPARAYTYPRISPNGSHLALDIRDQDQDIWIWDLTRESLSRLTTTTAVLEASPVWTADSQRVIFGSNRAGGRPVALYWQRADGSGDAEPLAASDAALIASSLSNDGTRLAFTRLRGSGQRGDLMLLHLDAHPPREESLLQTTANEMNPALSPDGKWVAYQSDESNREEIYVRPFPSVATGKWLISTTGGSRPLWGPDSKELFYLDADGYLTRVGLRTDGVFQAGKAQRVLKTKYFAGDSGSNSRTYDISSDGKRFLMIKQENGVNESASATPLVVVVNWIDELLSKFR